MRLLRNAQQRRTCLAAVLLTLLLVWGTPPEASAHLLQQGHGTLNLIGTTAYLALSLPQALFLPENAEARARKRVALTHLKQVFQAGIELQSDGREARWMEILPAQGTPQEGTEWVILAVAEFPGPVQSVTLTSHLWTDDSATLTLTATRSQEGQVVERDQQILSPEEPQQTVF